MTRPARCPIRSCGIGDLTIQRRWLREIAKYSEAVLEAREHQTFLGGNTNAS
jgi:hypothetical protein